MPKSKSNFSIKLLIFLYIIVFSAYFWTPYSSTMQFVGHELSPPSKIIWNSGLKLCSRQKLRDPNTFISFYRDNCAKNEAILFFGYSKNKSKWHLFYTKKEPIFLWGTDKLGRDVFSRSSHGSQISLSISIFGGLFTVLLGILLGGISGYYEGWIDNIIQRIGELLQSIPSLPLLLVLSSLVPLTYPSLLVYTSIILVIGFLNWISLSRVIRTNIISLKHYPYIEAAKALGASDWHILRMHIIPILYPYIWLHLCIYIPSTILTESTLSFLGLGIRDPSASLGLLLKDISNLSLLHIAPWLLLPAVPLIFTVWLWSIQYKKSSIDYTI